MNSARPPVQLEPGEDLLWSGAPQPRSVLRSGWVQARQRAVWAAALTLILAVAAVRGSEEPGIPLAALAGVSGLATAVLALWPLLAAAAAHGTVYAVTSRRLIISRRFPTSRLRTFAPGNLVPLRIRRSGDGSGDVLFALDVEAVEHASCGCGAGLCPTSSGRIIRVSEIRDATIEAPVGFRSLRDPDAVAALIQQHFGAAAAAQE